MSLPSFGEPCRNGDEITFSHLDRFPATATGNASFLAFIHSRVRGALAVKNAQRYTDKAIERLIHDIEWGEARSRATLLIDLPQVLQLNLREVLAGELSIGTLESIDEALAPLICDACEVVERARIAELEAKLIVVNTAGDLLIAYRDGKNACTESSGVSITPAVNAPKITYIGDVAEDKRLTLDRAQAHVKCEGDGVKAMQRLIAKVQLKEHRDWQSVISMPLHEFVAALDAKNSELITPNASGVQSKQSSAKPRRETSDEGLMRLLNEIGPEVLEWSSSELATKLGKEDDSTIRKSKAWKKTFPTLRALHQMESPVHAKRAPKEGGSRRVN